MSFFNPDFFFKTQLQQKKTRFFSKLRFFFKRRIYKKTQVFLINSGFFQNSGFFRKAIFVAGVWWIPQAFLWRAQNRLVVMSKMAGQESLQEVSTFCLCLKLIRLRLITSIKLCPSTQHRSNILVCKKGGKPVNKWRNFVHLCEEVQRPAIMMAVSHVPFCIFYIIVMHGTLVYCCAVYVCVCSN